jgi:hypothetical protein
MAKTNPFDDIARQVIADQEARDRAAGRDGPAPGPAKPTRPATPRTITVARVWGARRPDWLHRCTLVTSYEVRRDGTVWTTLQQVLGPDGKVVEDFWKLPLDFRTYQEVHGNGRKVVLKERTRAGLQRWLVQKGLAEPERTTKAGRQIPPPGSRARASGTSTRRRGRPSRAASR